MKSRIFTHISQCYHIIQVVKVDVSNATTADEIRECEKEGAARLATKFNHTVFTDTHINSRPAGNYPEIINDPIFDFSRSKEQGTFMALPDDEKSMFEPAPMMGYTQSQVLDVYMNVWSLMSIPEDDPLSCIKVGEYSLHVGKFNPKNQYILPRDESCYAEWGLFDDWGGKLCPIAIPDKIDRYMAFDDALRSEGKKVIAECQIEEWEPKAILDSMTDLEKLSDNPMEWPNGLMDDLRSLACSESHVIEYYIQDRKKKQKAQERRKLLGDQLKESGCKDKIIEFVRAKRPAKRGEGDKVTNDEMKKLIRETLSVTGSCIMEHTPTLLMQIWTDVMKRDGKIVTDTVIPAGGANKIRKRRKRNEENSSLPPNKKNFPGSGLPATSRTGTEEKRKQVTSASSSTDTKANGSDQKKRKKGGDIRGYFDTNTNTER